MTMTDATETVIVYPEVRVPASHREELAEANALADEILPMMKRLGELALVVRGVYDDALFACATAGLPAGDDDVMERTGHAVGWLPLWNKLADLTHCLGADAPESVGLMGTELDRGAPDHAAGTRALIALPDDGEVVEMEVVGRPALWQGVEGEHYRVRLVGGEGTYLATHEEIAAGVERLRDAS